jgi:hypothetical protein
MVPDDDIRQAEKLFRASEERAARLSSEALRFISTAEYVAGRLEAEKPLAFLISREDLSADRQDKDMGRVAAFCADPSRKPPEVGAFAHFLQTVIDSKQRRENSVLVRAFLKLLASWPGSQWLLLPDGLHAALSRLTTKFRNPVAHTDELSQYDYSACREHVIGTEGTLWKLLVATEPRR